MSSVVPPAFLFRYAFPVPRMAGLPRTGKRLLDLPEACALPDLGRLGGGRAFGEIRVAWNGGGLGVSAIVVGKTQRPVCRPDQPAESDGLQVWIDTRNTQSIHRAGRFCHHFCLLPADCEEKGTGTVAGRLSADQTRGTTEPVPVSSQPRAVQLPIARAREDAPLSRPEEIPVAVEWRPDGYLLEAWLSAETLTGFDPEANPRLGFYYALRDAELGEQVLTVGREFPFAHDPSLWCTLELAE